MKNMVFKSVLIVFLLTGISYGQDYSTKVLKEWDKKKDAGAAFKVAKEAFEKGALVDAQKILLTIKDYKKDAEFFDLFAKVWEKYGVTDNARSSYEEAEVLDPKNIDRKYILADMYFKMDSIRASANKYLEIIKLDSTSKKAYFELGSIFFKAGKSFRADAAKYLEKTLKYYDDLKIFKNCAKAYSDANNTQKVYDIATKGLAKYPADLELKKQAWISSYMLKKDEDALKYIQMIPDSTLSSAEMKAAAQVAERLNNNAVATKYYNMASEKDPNDKDLYVRLANKAYDEKNYDVAIDYFNKKLALDPKHEKSLLFKAWSYKLKKDYQGARNGFVDYLAVNDTSIAGWLNLAECYDKDKLDSLSKKFEIYNKILKMIDGKERQYKDVAASINTAFGIRAYDAHNWSSALTYLKKAMSLKGEEFSFLVMTAACYENLKDYDNAVAYYQKAKRINPNDENVKKGLRRLSAD